MITAYANTCLKGYAMGESARKSVAQKMPGETR